MRPSLPVRVFLWVLLLGLLAVPFVMRQQSAAPTAESEATAVERYGFYLQEVSAEAGIQFTHEAPLLDPKLEHIMPQVASMGAAVSVVDFDRDGWQDIYVTNSRHGTANALYRNLGDGTFEDVAAQVGLADVNQESTGVSMGAVWGDYDNDGFEDLFLYKWGRSELFHNDAGQGFTRVTEGTGLPAWANINAGIWFDYDSDGFLDLFFGGYYSEELNLWDLEDTRMMPESFEYAQNGGRKYLLRGHGDGTFEDQTALLGPETHRWMMAAAAVDLRGTGYPDLFVANDYGVDELLLNQGGDGFVAAGEDAGIGFTPKSGMNVAFGDILNQGQPAIYVSNITESGILMQGNNLWVPQPSAEGTLRYQNLASAMGVEQGGWSYGAQFGDLNNDGALDLFLTNGYVSADRKASYWYDFSKVAGGNSSIIGDARHWPAMEGRSLSGYQQKKVWLNDGVGRFQEVAQAVGVTHTTDGRSVAFADLWNRGVLDVIVAHQRGPLMVYKNQAAETASWITFDLEGQGSNRSAIGATIELHWNGKQQVQTVHGGSGFCAQNQRRLHFGLGPNAQVEKAVVRWPSGVVQEIPAPEAGRHHAIKESTGASA